MHIIVQGVKLLIVVCPAFIPIIAFFFQYRKGNVFCWSWLVGGLIMFTGLALTIWRYGLVKLQNM
ncbi:MAG: hypothetical protein M3Q73_02655 [bacterium]|nr:hypothetical protein [bacterium]